jgi:Zn-dependent oligopeptidase
MLCNPLPDLLQAGQPKAYFYLDPYSRPAEKRGGAWMAEVVGQVREGGGTQCTVPGTASKMARLYVTEDQTIPREIPTDDTQAHSFTTMQPPV